MNKTQWAVVGCLMVLAGLGGWRLAEAQDTPTSECAKMISLTGPKHEMEEFMNGQIGSGRQRFMAFAVPLPVTSGSGGGAAMWMCAW